MLNILKKNFNRNDLRLNVRANIYMNKNLNVQMFTPPYKGVNMNIHGAEVKQIDSDRPGKGLPSRHIFGTNADTRHPEPAI